MNQKGGGIAHAGRPMADPFVGREHELQRLQAAVMAALSGRGSVLLVGGEPGIGKTRTCEELAEYARGCGASVVWGRCYEGEGAPAFWPWVQIIRSCITDLDAGRLQQTLGAGASAIGQLVSPLGTLVEDGVPLVVTESPESRFRLFDAVVRLLEYVSQQTP
ncbi:MAG TPA: ATP-binding protein, partial [Candidatus Margulisiibacteriota bacterium]|nr:ATP-binding protein [Candidatus Margulisiibacteriota bacterium]